MTPPDVRDSDSPLASASLERSLRASRLFGGLPAPVVADFAKNATRRRYVRADHVWRAGDPAGAFRVILSGLVKICHTAPDGNLTIIALFGPRESIGDTAVLSNIPYPAHAIAASDSLEIASVAREPVMSLLERNLEMSQAIRRALLEHSEALREKIKIMSAGPVASRLATLLLHLADRFGDEVDEGTAVGVSLSRLELSCLVGATVETTIRVMSRWQKDGLISTRSDGFVLHDVAALIAITQRSATGE